MSQPKNNEGTRKTLYDIADFNDVFPDVTSGQKQWMAEYGSIMKEMGTEEALAQKDAEVVRKDKIIDVLLSRLTLEQRTVLDQDIEALTPKE